MQKKETQRRVYTPEFKAEAAALAEKREKPVIHAAAELDLNESVLQRWVQDVRETAATGRRAFPGHGRPLDHELARPARQRQKGRSP